MSYEFGAFGLKLQTPNETLRTSKKDTASC